MSSEHGEASAAIGGIEATTSTLNPTAAEVQLNRDQQRHRAPLDGETAIGTDSISNNFRRHSLPASTGSVSLLSSPLVGADCLADGSAFGGPASQLDGQQQEREQQPQHQQQQQQTGPLTPRHTNTSKHGHRPTKSTQTLPDQPVLVRAYSPTTENNMTTAIEEQTDDSERVELPPIDAFSFDGILKSIDPKVSRTVETISQLSSGYRSNLTHETDLLIEAQKSIDSQIIHADRLSNQVLKTTNARSDKLRTEAAPFKNGNAVEELAQSAESAYAMVENIIATLQAIDQMLPAQDQLSPEDSPHKFHYPYTHSLLAVKATEIRRRQASSEGRFQAPHPSSYSHSTTSSSQQQPLPAAGASSSASRVTGVTSQIPITHRSHRQAPLIHYNYPPLSVQQRKMSSPPNMQLRTIMPSPSPDSPKPPIATPTVASPSSSNKGLPAGPSMATTDRDSRSMLAASIEARAPSTRSSFSFKNILWGSNWGRGSRSSVGAYSSHGGSQIGGETAEDRLRKIMEAQSAKGKGVDTR